MRVSSPNKNNGTNGKLASWQKMKMDPSKWFALVVAFATGINVGVQLWGGGEGIGSTSTSSPGCPLPPPVPSTGSNVLRHAQQLPQQQPTSSPDTPDACQVEFDRVTAGRIPGITEDDLERSRAWMGHRGRLAQVMKDLREPPASRPQQTWVVSGGSISLGHGVEPSYKYSTRLEHWLNTHYPTAAGSSHQVLNRGTHGADICAMAKRLNMVVADLKPYNPRLFILEFAVNDYQGQDHEHQIDFKMDVFFDGYQDKALCTEMVVEGLLRHFPNAAILFLEFQTAVLKRKTAAFLHLGVAQQYQIPVISYAEAFMPDYERLMRSLEQFSYSTKTVPAATKITPHLTKMYGTEAANFTADPVLPFPHGCSPCRRDLITPGFRPNGCAHLCTLVSKFVNQSVICNPVPEGREPCFVSMWAHDEVHPSGVGHAMAKDLVVQALASADRDTCRGRTYPPALMPEYGFMVASPKHLRLRSEFVMVNDTYQFFVRHHPLEPLSNSPGFSMVEDRFGRPGWIADRPEGGDKIAFDIDLPHYKCYAVYMAVLKSYRGMGTFTVSVKDLKTDQTTNKEVDGLWKPHISIPHDIQLTQDSDPVAGCTGTCQVIVATHAKKDDRDGNKVKIMTLSVRKCFA